MDFETRIGMLPAVLLARRSLPQSASGKACHYLLGVGCARRPLQPW
jgi:hypothetical protein